MYQPPEQPAAHVLEARPLAPRDPVAVALGNASLFGVGYFLLGRRAQGVLAALVSVVLLVVLGSAAGSGWVQWFLLAWWVTTIGHGWLAARRRPTATRTRQRIGAGVLAVVVLGARDGAACRPATATCPKGRRIRHRFSVVRWTMCRGGAAGRGSEW